jgi:hypothetical protein
MHIVAESAKGRPDPVGYCVDTSLKVLGCQTSPVHWHRQALLLDHEGSVTAIAVPPIAGDERVMEVRQDAGDRLP